MEMYEGSVIQTAWNVDMNYLQVIIRCLQYSIFRSLISFTTEALNKLKQILLHHQTQEGS